MTAVWKGMVVDGGNVRRSFLACLLACAAVGCSPQALLDSAAKSEEALFAQDTVAVLFARDVDRLLARFSPELLKEATPDAVAKLLAQIPSGEPGTPTLVGYNYYASPGTNRALVSLQYRFPETYVVAQVQVSSAGSEIRITSLHLQRLPESLERLNAFTLAGRSAQHYAVLTGAVLVPAFILFALILCARTPSFRRKRAWLAFVALGIGQVSLNWTTGTVGFNPVSVRLLGAGATTAGPYAPWIVTVSFPLGAALFLIKRRRLASI